MSASAIVNSSARLIFCSADSAYRFTSADNLIVLAVRTYPVPRICSASPVFKFFAAKNNFPGPAAVRFSGANSRSVAHKRNASKEKVKHNFMGAISSL